MNETGWKILANAASFVLGGVVVGLGVFAWLRDMPNLAGLAVVFGIVAGLRGGILASQGQ